MYLRLYLRLGLGVGLWERVAGGEEVGLFWQSDYMERREEKGKGKGSDVSRRAITVPEFA